ncbi:MAG: helix-turn-helix transcriptional regulator [Acidimicrobiia bacterium]
MARVTGDTGGELVYQARTQAGLSQRGLAELAGTSGPTIAAYESGTREPRLSTLARLVGATGTELVVELHDGMTRSDRRSLALHAAIAERLATDPHRVLQSARRNLQTMRQAASTRGAHRLLDEWTELVADRNIPAITRVLGDRSEHARDLRQMTPFAGALNDNERTSVLAAAAALL